MIVKSTINAKARCFPAKIYLLKDSNKNTRKRCEICSKLTVKTLEQLIDVILVFLLLTLNIFHTFFYVSIVDFEQVKAS